MSDCEIFNNLAGSPEQIKLHVLNCLICRDQISNIFLTQEWTYADILSIIPKEFGRDLSNKDLQKLGNALEKKMNEYLNEQGYWYIHDKLFGENKIFEWLEEF